MFTAFGERIAGSADRHGFVGAWGYQNTIDPATGTELFPFQHLGARYYDPASGRFLQRDPIGILGGTNVYAYGANSPTIGIDPDGKFVFGAIVGGLIGGVVGYVTGGVAGAVGGAISGALVGAGVPAPVAGAVGGAVSGAISGGKTGGVGGAIVGGVAGGVTGGVGGVVGGTYGGTAGAIAGDAVGTAADTYFYQLPKKLYESMLCSAKKYGEKNWGPTE